MKTQLWTNCRLATLVPGAQGGAARDGASGNAKPSAYGLIEDGAMLVEGGRLAWVGPRAQLPPGLHADLHHDAAGALVTPGLIDCHTHLVYGGDRAAEFELRLKGATYEEIARAGGGIASTVRATRAATEAELVRQSQPRLKALLREGVTTLEIKSGYGLSLDAEARMLRAARTLCASEPVSLRASCLAAHALPPEFAGRADDYIDAVVAMLPVLHAEGLVDAVDAFCDTIGFTPAQTARVFDAARRLGLPVKLHAEQLSNSHGAALAASYGALSCDHLEWLDEAGARAMAAAGTVAVLLPGAFYFLRETRVPPVALLRAQGVPMALSTNCNPGSSPCTSLLLMLNMACTLFRLTPEEALAGVTVHAARALGLNDRGQLRAGLRADFVLWDVAHPAQLSYALGASPRLATIYQGHLT